MDMARYSHSHCACKVRCAKSSLWQRWFPFVQWVYCTVVPVHLNTNPLLIILQHCTQLLQIYGTWYSRTIFCRLLAMWATILSCAIVFVIFFHSAGRTVRCPHKICQTGVWPQVRQLILTTINSRFGYLKFTLRYTNLTSLINFLSLSTCKLLAKTYWRLLTCLNFLSTNLCSILYT